MSGMSRTFTREARLGVIQDSLGEAVRGRIGKPFEQRSGGFRTAPKTLAKRLICSKFVNQKRA